MASVSRAPQSTEREGSVNNRCSHFVHTSTGPRTAERRGNPAIRWPLTPEIVHISVQRKQEIIPDQGFMAVTVGFEPTVGGYPTQLFESCTFGRSDTSPPKSLRHDGRGRESIRHAPHAHPQQCRLHSSLPAAPAISSTARSGSSMPKVGCRIRPHFRAGCAGTRWAERRRFVSPSARSATEGTLPLALRERDTAAHSATGGARLSRLRLAQRPAASSDRGRSAPHRLTRPKRSPRVS